MTDFEVGAGFSGLATVVLATSDSLGGALTALALSLLALRRFWRDIAGTRSKP